MARDRSELRGCIEAFEPNVTVQNGVATVRPRNAFRTSA